MQLLLNSHSIIMSSERNNRRIKQKVARLMVDRYLKRRKKSDVDQSQDENGHENGPVEEVCIVFWS